MVQVNKKILVEQQRFSSYPSSSPFVLNVLEEAISGTDTLRSLPVGSSAAGKGCSRVTHQHHGYWIQEFAKKQQLND
ncbi:unknown protein [Oryza sativa Japonica Group]|uniref:Os01g0341601 protein n=1 Tax=Oryza sativa subsp. japonica TaxID=39947 RepID=Q5ZB30_ORYSJ|nr:unknown protein [Oryza sativa Japonica Group]BAH91048.1 Os01g0341601 [Oryza sativa Japonica Group]|eukprot:NP_001172318.1 Os01g0341601 [Oryza sativa Japonica Group]